MGVLRITFTITSPPAEDPGALEAEARADLARGLGHHLVSLDGTSLEARIGELLLHRGWTLAAAESCTGGRAAHKIVTVPGASRYFLGGVVAYSNEAKSSLLGVPAELIAAHGAVSEPVARAMARGARERLRASCGIGITGIAGPDGGSAEKPVGLVHLAAITPSGERARKIVYGVDREGIMELSANYALYNLWSMLRERGSV
jgi:nicotinamide-nucleotide amidase